MLLTHFQAEISAPAVLSMTHFTVSKMNKFPWSDLGASSPQLFGRGKIAPIAAMESAATCVCDAITVNVFNFCVDVRRRTATHVDVRRVNAALFLAYVLLGRPRTVVTGGLIKCS